MLTHAEVILADYLLIYQQTISQHVNQQCWLIRDQQIPQVYTKKYGNHFPLLLTKDAIKVAKQCHLIKVGINYVDLIYSEKNKMRLHQLWPIFNNQTQQQYMAVFTIIFNSELIKGTLDISVNEDYNSK